MQKREDFLEVLETWGRQLQQFRYLFCPQSLRYDISHRSAVIAAEMEKVGDTGDISLLFFLAGANFWAILGNFWAILAILGHFWAIMGNFG